MCCHSSTTSSSSSSASTASAGHGEPSCEICTDGVQRPSSIAPAAQQTQPRPHILRPLWRLYDLPANLCTARPCALCTELSTPDPNLRFLQLPAHPHNVAALLKRVPKCNCTRWLIPFMPYSHRRSPPRDATTYHRPLRIASPPVL